MKVREKELEGDESKLREKKESKKLSREPQEAPEAIPSLEISALPSTYEQPKEPRVTSAKLRWSCGGAVALVTLGFGVPPKAS